MTFVDLPLYLLAALGAVAIVLLGYLIQGYRLKKRQMIVDQALMEIADPQLTPVEVFLKHLENFGIITPERINLAGKYGPGIASDISLAKLLARLVSERAYPESRIATGLVNHFLFEERGRFTLREARLLVFLEQILICFQLDDPEELLDRCAFSYAVLRHLAHWRKIEHKRAEDARQLAQEKAKCQRQKMALQALVGKDRRRHPAALIRRKVLPVRSYFF